MWLLAAQFISAFSEESAPLGWHVEYLEDDELAVFARTMTPGIDAELGFDLTERDYGLSLNPAVSVRHREISDLHAHFFGFERGASQVGTSLSGLVHSAGGGAGTMWTVGVEDEIPAVVADILTSVNQLAEHFYAKYASTSELVQHLKDSAKSNLDVAQLAVALAVTGDLESVNPLLERLEEMIRQQPRLVAEQTRRFLSAFREHFGEPI